jgi:hypothetical protein
VKGIALPCRGLCLIIIELLQQGQQQNSLYILQTISTKTVQQELYKSIIQGTAAIAKPLITEKNTKWQKRWWDDHKTWTFDDQKYVIWSDKSSFTLFPTSGRIYVRRTSKEAYNPECQVRTVKHTCDDLSGNVIVFCWSYNYSAWLN